MSSRRPIAVSGALVGVGLSLWCAPLYGHPVGVSIPSHQLQLTVDGADVRVDYSIRLPTRWIMKEIGDRESFSPEQGAAFTAEKLDELARGIKLVDGDVSVPLGLSTSDEVTGLGDSKFLTYDLVLTGALPEGDRHALTLTQMNYPDEHSYFMIEALLDPQYRVESTSLFRIEDDRARFSVYGQWRMEEEMRELELTIAAPTTALARRARAAAVSAEEPAPATELVAVTELEHLAGGALTRRAAMGAAAAFFLLGLAGARGGARRWWLWGLGIVEAGLAGALALGGLAVGAGLAGALAAGAAAGGVTVWLSDREDPPGRAVTGVVLLALLGVVLSGLAALSL